VTGSIDRRIPTERQRCYRLPTHRALDLIRRDVTSSRAFIAAEVAHPPGRHHGSLPSARATVTGAVLTQLCFEQAAAVGLDCSALMLPMSHEHQIEDVHFRRGVLYSNAGSTWCSPRRASGTQRETSGHAQGRQARSACPEPGRQRRVQRRAEAEHQAAPSEGDELHPPQLLGQAPDARSSREVRQGLSAHHVNLSSAMPRTASTSYVIRRAAGGRREEPLAKQADGESYVR
jgi:hypothetical protein